MKKLLLPLLAALLIAAMALGVTGCNKPAEQLAPADTPAPTQSAAEPEAPVEVPEFALDMEVVTGLNGLQPVYESLMMAMREYSEDAFAHYQSNDPGFFWQTLYYLCANAGELDDRNTPDPAAAELLVPYAVMEEYAAACFFDYVALLPLPEEPIGITIDEEKESYRIAMSDKGDSYVTPVKYEYVASDEYEVLVAWLSHGEEYPDMQAAYMFIVGENPYVARSGVADPMYKYAVKYAYETYTDVVMVTDTYERSGKKYAVVDPVVIRRHGALDVDEEGNPYGYDWDEVINDTEESVEYLISEYAEFDFGQLDWTFEDLVMEDALEDGVSFFMENAKRESEGEHLVFHINAFDGVLYFAKFADEIYFVG